MDARDLRIGDWVRIKNTGFEARVIGIYCDLLCDGDPEKAELQLDFESNMGGVWEYTSDQVEPIEPITPKRKTDKPNKQKTSKDNGNKNN